MDGYLDFGSDSGDEDSPNELNNQIMEVDSDEEERNQNDQILKMLMEKSDSSYAKSKKDQAIEDFEAEMEAELDRRASEVEKEGGMKHQMSLSRSSSTSSLNKVSTTTAEASDQGAGGSASAGPSANKRPRTMLKDPKSNNKQSSPKKSVKFSEETTSTSVDEAIKISDPPAEQAAKKNSTKRYEDIYFDSDESEGEDDTTRKMRRDKREFLTNDDLFYDPKSDSKDQEWVDKRRRQYYEESRSSSAASAQAGSSSTKTKAGQGLEEELGRTSRSKSVKLPPGVKPLPTSDAVLNCPACFTVLCLDCQRHEFYNNQYRAMFVMNCIVNAEEVIYAPLKQKKSRSWGSKAKAQSFSTEPTGSDDVKDKFNTVKCKVCSTQIGVYDHDEVYHFINVLASHS